VKLLETDQDYARKISVIREVFSLRRSELADLVSTQEKHIRAWELGDYEPFRGYAKILDAVYALSLLRPHTLDIARNPAQAETCSACDGVAGYMRDKGVEFVCTNCGHLTPLT
jgi:ribosome-binding protein aMBF1 (putative translation factor)